MIFDEIISLFFSIFEGLFGFLFEGFALFFGAIINFFILLIELIIGIFITGFSMKRVKPYKRKNKKENDNECNQQRETRDANKTGGLIIIALVIGFFIFKPMITVLSYKDVTFVAKDGHSLPFASVVIYRNGTVEHKRTKNDGSLRIEKSGLEKIVLNDKRYIETTWLEAEIDDILVVKRTILGSGLDVLAKKLLKPKN